MLPGGGVTGRRAAALAGRGEQRAAVPLAPATGPLRLGPDRAPVVELIGSGVIGPRPLLSEPLPLEEFGEALHRVRTGQGI